MKVLGVTSSKNLSINRYITDEISPYLWKRCIFSADYPLSINMNLLYLLYQGN